MTEAALLSGKIAIMSVTEWTKIPDNPRQRNTPQHSSLAADRHLKKYSESQEFVAMACMDGKPLCKVDGHSRSFLWKTHQLEPPPDGNVVVILYHVKSIERAKELYDEHDNPGAVKRPKDFLFSAIREHGFQLESPLLRSTTFSWQLAILERMSRSFAPLPITIEKWKPHLIELDQLWLSDNYKIVIGFMLIAIKFKGIETAGRFLADLDKDRGIKNSSGRDGVEAVREAILHRRTNNLVNKEIHRKETWEVAWSGFIKWTKGEMIKNNYRLAPNRGIWEAARLAIDHSKVPLVTETTMATVTRDFTEVDTTK